MKFWEILYLGSGFWIKHAQYAQSGTLYLMKLFITIFKGPATQDPTL